MCRPPMGIVRAGLRGVMVNCDGARADHLHHEVAAHADVGAVHGAARAPQDLDRLGVQELDPDLLEDAHRRVVDARHAFGGSGSVGRSVLTGMRQGIWSITAVPRRLAFPARPPLRLRRVSCPLQHP